MIIFTIAVCEDNIAHAGDIYNLIDNYKSCRADLNFAISTFQSGSELLSFIENKHGFDLYLLDILMPEMSGIELAHKLRALNLNAPVVFLTSSADYALDAFRVSAMQYLLKPICEESLFPILDKLTDDFVHNREDCLIISTPNDIVKIPRSSIIYVELSKRKLLVFLADGSSLHSKTMRIPFAQAVAPLLRDCRFHSAHKSFVLNMARARKLTSNSFIMENGAVLPIPRYKYTEAKAKYFAWLSSQGIGSLGGKLS